MGAKHYANIGGETDAALTDVATSLSSPALAALPEIASPDFIFICVDPDGIAGAPEWMKITAHTAAATTATVERAAESSTARAHKADIEWVHTLAPSEMDAAVPLLLHVRDEKASGTEGGTFTSGAWQTRTLNTVKTNEISGAALASNQVTLPVGTYEAIGWVIGYKVDYHQSRLYDTTGASTLVVGSPEVNANASAISGKSMLEGRFTLSTESVIELQHKCSQTVSGNGFGTRSNAGEVEVYANLMIRKVA